MEIILLQDVKALGKKGDIVKVNDGYARNCILPKKLGVEATKKTLAELKGQQLSDAKKAKEILEQAKELEKIADLDAVFVLEVNDDIVMYRAMGRRCCKNCGAITHIGLLNGKTNCLKCGGELYIRSDATEEATKAKMESFYKDTKPLIDFYKGKYPLYFVDANKNPEYTLQQVEKVLNKIK